MATLNLTTSDNYLTVIVNGTTIKQMYAKQGDNGTPVKVYQKWKTTHVEQYTNTAGDTYRGGGWGVNYKYWMSGHHSTYTTSYCEYRLKTELNIKTWGSPSVGRARILGYIDGTLKRTSDYTTGSSLSYLDTYKTIKAVNDSSYDTKNYSCYWVLLTSAGSSTDTGYGSENSITTSTVYTPSRTSKSTGATAGTSTYKDAVAYQGVDTSYDYREEDN